MRLLVLLGALFYLPSMVNAQILFKEEAALLGLEDACGNTYLGNGISFTDYNNDGWDDVSFTTGIGESVKFYKNTNGIFSEEILNLPLINYQTKQINWVDYDNDGDKDLFVTSDTDGNRLFQNDGNLNFQDVTLASGISTANMYSYGASWGDINNDGHLDIFISNRDLDFINTNKLYQNDGDGTFTDVTVLAGVDASALSFCSAFFDYNNDGFQDIYVSNDKFPVKNLMYKNNGDGTFDEVGQATETDVGIDAMTVTVGDYNNDSWFDIYVTNSPDGNVLFKNNGDGTFIDIADTSGTLFESIGWGAVWLDAENDMDLDLYVSGSPDGSYEPYLSAAFYKNIGPDSFEIPTDAGFTGDEASSYSNAIGDINNDGLPEIVVSNNLEDNIFIWNNLTTTSNNWLKVKLEGTVSNRDGIGSVLEISINDNKQYRYTHCGEGYLSQNSESEFFGLGPHTSVDYLKVTWLSGIVDYFYNVSANQLLEVTEGSGTLSLNNQPDLGFNLYPNPVSSFLNINSKILIHSFEILTLTGQRLFLEDVFNKQLTFDISSLPSGTYFIKLKTDSSNNTLKFIKR